MGDRELLYVGKTFNSYVEFEENLELYQKKTFSLYTTKTSKSVAAVNRIGKCFKEDLKYYNLVLCCKRGGLKRICSGKGQRDIQGTWKVDCPSTIAIRATENNTLKVVQFNGTHANHECTEEEVNLYPESRKESLKSCEEELDILFKANVKPSKMRLMLREVCSGPINPRDLMNLRAKWKNINAGGRSETQRLVDALCGIMEKDEGAFIYVVKDEETGELINLFIQTSSMRQNSINFVRVLLMDHTYKINKNRMPTCLLMVMDGNGDGRVAGLAYLGNEKKENVINTLTAFKTSVGQDIVDKIKTAVIDKDMSEAGALSIVLPAASIQLCDFHVSKTFKLRSAHESDELRKLLKRMRFAKDDDEFNKLCQEAKAVASENFWKYFDENWVHCSMAWSFRDKKKSLNLGNTTTARLECFNGKIKIVLNCNNTLAESVEGVLGIVTNKEEDSAFKTRMEATKEFYSTTSNDPIVFSMLNDLTKFAAKRCIEELKADASESEVAKFKSTVKECTCSFYSSYELPCRHMFQMRRFEGVTVYDVSEINDPMWKKGGVPQPARVPHFRSAVRCDLKVQPKSAADKYNHSLSVCKQLCSVLSERGPDQYARLHRTLKDFYHIVASNEEYLLLKIINGNSAVSVDGKITVALPTISSPIADNTESVPNAPVIIIEEVEVTGNASNTNETAENQDNNSLTSLPLVIDQNAPSADTIVDSDSVVASVTHSSLPIQTILPYQFTGNHVPVPHITTGVLNIYRGPSSDVQSTRNPTCFCGIPTVRLVASSSSRMAGQPFWKCSLKAADQASGCRFWRVCKKETTSQEGLASVSGIAKSNNNSSVLQDEMLTMINDDENEALNDLLALIESSENEERNNASDVGLSSTNNGEVNGVVPDACVQEGENVALFTATETNVDRFRQSLASMTLPLSVKCKGRPKDSGNTLLGTLQKGTKRSGRALQKQSYKKFRKSPNYESDMKKERARNIADEDVTFDGRQWTVKSQNEKETGCFYSVQKKDTSFPCQCQMSDNCPHKFTCTCKTFVKPCKHIYKVSSMVCTPEVTDILPTEEETETNDCIACKYSGPPSPNGAHKCDTCSAPVHAIDPSCSVKVGGAEEGFGAGDRRCLPCFRKSQTSLPHETSGTTDELCNSVDNATIISSTSPPVFQNGDLGCVVCRLPGILIQCVCCSGVVHTEDCSIDNPDDYPSDARLCKNCYCLLCKRAQVIGHCCECHICHKQCSPEEDFLCYRCEKITHATLCSSYVRDKQKDNKMMFICKSCLLPMISGITVSMYNELTMQKMLSDEHIARASVMLSAQYGKDIDGLCAPLAVTLDEKVDSINYYPTLGKSNYVQIMNNGRLHWVTAIFQAGSTKVSIMDSLKKTEISGHLKTQVCMIAKSDKPSLTVVRPQCKQQTNGVDCGLFAIANAVEFCHEGKIQFVDFKASDMRRHFLTCMENGILTPFPRLSKRPQKSPPDNDEIVISLYCSCRLPDCISNLVGCDQCPEWYHIACVGPLEDPEAEWICPQCVGKREAIELNKKNS